MFNIEEEKIFVHLETNRFFFWQGKKAEDVRFLVSDGIQLSLVAQPNSEQNRIMMHVLIENFTIILHLQP